MDGTPPSDHCLNYRPRVCGARGDSPALSCDRMPGAFNTSTSHSDSLADTCDPGHAHPHSERGASEATLVAQHGRWHRAQRRLGPNGPCWPSDQRITCGSSPRVQKGVQSSFLEILEWWMRSRGLLMAASCDRWRRWDSAPVGCSHVRLA